jgi:hypothetical protein
MNAKTSTRAGAGSAMDPNGRGFSIDPNGRR